MSARARRSLVAVLLVLLPAAVSARQDRTPDRALAGLVAGPPQSCMPLYPNDSGGDVYDSGDILYRGRGGTVFRNHPADCPMLKSGRRIVTQTPTGSFCRGDLVQISDRLAPISYGACPLGDFVPYRKPGW